VVTLYYHNTEATKEVHHVRCLQDHPNHVLVPAGKVGDCGEDYFGAESGEEYMLVDKEAIYCQFDILLELMSSLGTLTILCVTRLPFRRTIFPFILRTDRPQVTSAALTSPVVTSDPVTPPVLTLLTIALKSEVKGKINFSYSSLALFAPAIWRLLNNFILSCTVWTNPNHDQPSQCNHLRSGLSNRCHLGLDTSPHVQAGRS
jgi:hypothetical protein